MTPTERKKKARDALERRINQEVFSGRFGKPDVEPELTVDAAIDAYAAACVAETRASIVAWIRGTNARIAAQAKAGVGEVHYMHTIGLRDAARQLADAIEAEADKEPAK